MKKKEALVTVVLLNYQRPKNLELIINTFSEQSIGTDIFVWNNSEKRIKNKKIKWLVHSSENRFCWPRWYMASFARTPYVLMIDDDLTVTTKHALENLLNFYEIERCREDQLIGIEGVVLKADAPYFPICDGRIYNNPHINGQADCVHIKTPANVTKVDIVKGRLIFCHKNAPKKLRLTHQFRDTCDDIAVSRILSKGRTTYHILTSVLNHSVIDLPGKNDWMALSRSSDWQKVRNGAKKFYYSSPKK